MQTPDLSDYGAVQRYLYGLRHHGARYGIDRMPPMLARLGNPHRRYPVIHVAGTNGKGSTCAMLEAIYRSAGNCTGLFTSPHLVYQGERVQVNRQRLGHEEIADYTRQLQPIAAQMAAEDPESHPSFFEFMTAMAFLRFSEAPVDVALIETGLGGRLDATNVVDPALSIITSVSFDHTEILGDTLAKIAFEKAGIIKAGKPVVMGCLPPEAEAVVRARAEELGSPLYSVRERFGRYEERYPETILPGDFQRLNAAAATLAAEVLREQFPVTDHQIRQALMQVAWAGRWERHSAGDREVILDATHNPEGARFLDQQLARLVRQTGVKPVIAAGSLGDLRAKALLEVIARHAREIVLIRPHQPRACSFEALEAAVPADFHGRVSRGSVREVFPVPGVCTLGHPGETVVVTGSIYLIGEAMEALYHETRIGEELLQD
ncbi:MAG: folylpolyglutamate synthase/dihydrofolate synthase family protein [Verrucomicrobiota bacterium JB022]|nr:folylpolyglutamate synthase/dihydrofolate synthase family protein [Verrucomicrobiota bacterium JB022]